MAEQLIFDLPVRVAMGRADFYISEANAAAVAALDGWHDWAFSKLLLLGPEGSGKTHLSHVFAMETGAEIWPAEALTEAAAPGLAEADALVLEDVDQIAGNTLMEELVFHLHNALAHRGAPLLLTAKSAPGRWGLLLPDLLSRMQQAGQIALQEPDDTLIGAVMMKLAFDRGIGLSPQIISYVVPRIDRSLASAARFIAELDRETLAAKEKPGLKHAKSVLERL